MGCLCLTSNQNYILSFFKGGFYYNESIDAIVSNSFALDLQSESNIVFSIETYETPIHSSNF
jgi:hypothetical protein